MYTLQFSTQGMTQELLKICSFNARGLRDKVKRNAVFSYFQKHHKGILFLQECHSCINTEKIWKREWKGNIFFSHGGTNKHGVAILFPRKTTFKVNKTINDKDGRYILIDVDIDKTNYILVNLYAPTKDHMKDQITTFLEIQSVLMDYSDSNLIIGGDFNICLNPYIDKEGGKKEKINEYSKLITDFMNNLELNDIWRLRNPLAKRFSHRQKNKAGLVHSRIDYFLCSTHLCYFIKHTNIAVGLFSDHSIIEITIRTIPWQRLLEI